MEHSNGWGEVFDEIKAKEGISSDSKLALSLGVSRAFICAVRKNRKGVSNELGEKLFLRLGRRVIEEELDLFMSSRMQKIAKVRRADPEVKAIVMQRAKGICELCKTAAPFNTQDGEPYLEIHYIVPVRLGGKIETQNMVALCPNCHRKLEICPSNEDILQITSRAGRKMNQDELSRLMKFTPP